MEEQPIVLDYYCLCIFDINIEHLFFVYIVNHTCDRFSSLQTVQIQIMMIYKHE